MEIKLKIILITKSYMIFKSLNDILLESFSNIEYFESIENFDDFALILEKNKNTIIFVDEYTIHKDLFYFKDLFSKHMIIPILISNEFNFDCEFNYKLNINYTKKQINKLIEDISIHKNNELKINTKNKELTKREKLIIQLITKGLTTKEIADKLGNSNQTISSHRKNITAKLGIRSVSALTVYAILNNIITLEN